MDKETLTSAEWLLDYWGAIHQMENLRIQTIIEENTMTNTIFTLCITLWLFSAPWSHAEDKADYTALLAEATVHLKSFSSHDQSEAITNIVGAAKAVVIIPDEKSASLIVGYKTGIGAMFRRHGTAWSDPVFMEFKKYSVGAQAGGSRNEVLVMILTNKIADGVVDGIDQLGGGGGFALGTLGLGSTGGGSLGGGLEMMSVSTKKGLVLGGSIEDASIAPVAEFNLAAYGKDYDITKILSRPGGVLTAAQELRQSLVKATSKSFNE